MTKEQLDTIREHVSYDDVSIHDVIPLLAEVERLKNDLAMARQVSGELCEACGWAMKFPGEPCRCELVKWRDEWEAFKACMTEQGASAFARGAEAMRNHAVAIAHKYASLTATHIVNELLAAPVPKAAL